MTPAPWEMPPVGAPAALAATLAAGLPRLVTERLSLRAPEIADFDAYARIFLSDRWHDEGGRTREDAWLDFAQMVAGWMLRGMGLMAIDKRGGEHVGFVVLNHEYGDAHAEVGWMLNDGSEGNGYATEAARAALRFAFGSLRLKGLVSYIAPSNTASIRVAERLGAQLAPETESGCLVFRHQPEVLQ